MGKPLLTDDIIEKANRNEAIDDYDGIVDDFEDTIIPLENRQQICSFNNDDDGRIVQSRRIENAKRSAFQSKLNIILLGLIVILALVLYAVFNW